MPPLNSKALAKSFDWSRADVRAAAIDLDGTLLSDDKNVSERNRDALLACADAGVPVVLATSRPGRTICYMVGNELLKRTSVVMMNGAVAYGRPPLTGTVRNALPPGMAAELVKMARQVKAVRVFVELDGFRVGVTSELSRDEIAALLGGEPEWDFVSAMLDELAPMPEVLKEAPTKVMIHGLPEDTTPLKNRVYERFGNALEVFAYENNAFLNIVRRGVSKSAGLRSLLEPAGISLDQVVAFGDDGPDSEMLAACGYGVAMENASDEVIAAADLLTSSNNNDGVAEVLERILGIGGYT